ncbi:MAG: hypothetical protein RIB60_03430 [Phycisphaerales bacterium]
MHRIFTILVLLAASAVGAGAQQDLGVEPAVARIDAVQGRPLAFRVTVENERIARKPITLRMDDGTDLTAELYWVSAAADPDAEYDNWLGPRPLWTAIPGDVARRMDDRPPGAWHVVADLPLGVYGQGVWFGPTRYQVAWLPDPYRLALRAGGGAAPDGLWEPSTSEEARETWRVQRAVSHLSRTPYDRWRARLLMDGLRPPAELVGIAEQDGPILPFTRTDPGDPGARALEAIAEVIEARWQVALARLWMIDPELCRSVRYTAAGVARFTDASGEDVWAPAWDPSPLVVEDLLEDLLSPFVDDETRALRARAWLATQPRAVVWVFDDAGRQDAVSGDLLPTLGVVSTPRREGASIVTVDGTRASLEPVPPRELRVVGASVPAERRPIGVALPETEVGVRVGSWRTEARVHSVILEARPPGASLGPLLEDWTLPAWREGATVAGAVPPPGARTSVLLVRRARPTGVETRSGWTLLVECNAAGVDDPDATDAVRIWLGAYGRPSAVLRVSRDGTVTDEATSASPGFGGRNVPVADAGGSWAFEITLPPDAVGDDGILRIGLDRTDATGRHTGWPRRMLPWQAEPGRLAIDTASWDALGP